MMSYLSIVQKSQTPVRQLEQRINLNHRTLSRLSVDLKVIPKSHKGHKFILSIIDEVTTYLKPVPIYHSRSEKIGNALIENVISKYCLQDYIIMGQDRTFISSLMN